MITSRKFETLPDGKTVTAYDLISDAGFHATILSYGATLQSLTFPDGTDVVLGFDNIEGYLGNHPYLGAAIGRVANRIGGASFEIDGTEFKLPKNEDRNNLHSGPNGFDSINWFGEIDGNTLILRYTSPDGHQGFPGELLTELRFSFDGSTLALDIQAIIDKPCPVNITYHPYFNLTDGGATPCTDHHLQILTHRFTPTDDANLPTGSIISAHDGTQFDYSAPKAIAQNDPLDQNFVIKSSDVENGGMVKMAKLSSVTTGHKVIICSTEACLQAYAGGHIPRLKGKAGTVYGASHGIALEPQSFPDALNHENFPNNILRPGQIYRHRINYTFRPGAVQA